MERFFDPAVLLSLATAMYAGALWLWFVSRSAPRAILTLAAACALAHLTLMRYHSLLNSPSLHLLLALFWLVPLWLYTARGGFADSEGAHDKFLTIILFAYALIAAGVFFSAVTSDLLFVLLFQPGLLLSALALRGRGEPAALIFMALACFWALLWFLAYAPLAPVPDASDSTYGIGGGGSEICGDQLQMWPFERAYLAIFWAAASLPILRDAPDRPRFMVWGAVVFFGGLVQYRMGSLFAFLGAVAFGSVMMIAALRLDRRLDRAWNSGRDAHNHDEG